MCKETVCDPQIVILDEPFSGLDPVNAMLLEDLVKECIQPVSYTHLNCSTIAAKMRCLRSLNSMPVTS